MNTAQAREIVDVLDAVDAARVGLTNLIRQPVHASNPEYPRHQQKIAEAGDEYLRAATARNTLLGTLSGALTPSAPLSPQEEAAAIREGGSGGESSARTPTPVTPGRVVIYRSKTGTYDLPAIVAATAASLDPTGVELGHVPELGDDDAVHLVVFTAGTPGTAREGNPVNEAQTAGTYQEWDVPWAGALGEPQPGTWRWPERV